jgi:hypothetical protein
MGWEAIVADAMSEVRDDGMVDGSGYYCNNSATWRAPVRSFVVTFAALPSGPHTSVTGVAGTLVQTFRRLAIT